MQLKAVKVKGRNEVDKFRISHFLAAFIDNCGASNFAVIDKQWKKAEK